MMGARFNKYLTTIFKVLKNNQLAIWLIVVTSIAMGFFVWRGWHNFEFPILDLGLYNRHMWGLVRLDFSANPLKGFNLLGDHSHFILLLLAPIYAVSQTPVTLLVVQVLCISLSGWPIYLIAKKYFKDKRIAALWLVPYYMYFGFWSALAYPFHVSAIAVLPLSWALYFLLEKNYRYLVPTLIIMSLIKEDMPLVAAMMGVYIFVIHRKYLLGSIIVGAGGLYCILVIKFWLPTVSHIRYYYTDAVVPVRSVITNPLEFWQSFVSTRQKSDTIWSMLMSFAGLPLIGLEILILLLPIWAGRFLSVQGHRWSFEQHYSANQGPILVTASIVGLVRIVMLIKKYYKLEKYHLMSSWVIGGIVCIIFSIIVWMNFDLRNTIIQKVLFTKSNPAHVSARKAIKLIPEKASVGAQSAFPQVTSRREVYNLPLDLDSNMPDYLLLSETLSNWPFSGASGVKKYINDAKDRGYRAVVEENGVYLLKK